RALREEVHALTRAAQAVLRPQVDVVVPARLERRFTLRTNEGFVERFAAPLAALAAREAPGVQLRFAPKPEKDAAPLREGLVDLEIGVLGAFAPEVRTQLLRRDRFVGAVRTGHPLLDAPITPERYAACRHIVASRKGAFEGPVDAALAPLGLSRRVAVVVPAFADALRIARRSDLVGLVPETSLTADTADGLVSFPLPVATPAIAISMLWHPRLDADPEHRWLRETVQRVCREAEGERL
ncbi:LysR substrate-binding domain-containing protein, partial [Novosphingobium sp. 1949]